MSKYSTAAVRNLAMVGSSGTGKTMLCEAILHLTGATTRLGSISEGTTTSDVDADEQAKQHSIRLGVMHAVCEPAVHC